MRTERIEDEDYTIYLLGNYHERQAYPELKVVLGKGKRAGAGDRCRCRPENGRDDTGALQ